MSRSNYFSSISKINPEREDSWQGKLFLSFDIDWAHDEVILDTLKLVSNAGVESTWFVTHQTDVLAKLESNPKVELGIHPNFNRLLDGGKDGDSREVLKNIQNLVPSATAIRSHSLTSSERLMDQYHEGGLTHVSNHFIRAESMQRAYPFRMWDDLIIVPHQWQDNVAMRIDLDFLPDFDSNFGYRLYDFHPIHVFLNTESMKRYESTRAIHRDPEALIKHRYEGYGTRSRLLDILAMHTQPS